MVAICILERVMKQIYFILISIILWAVFGMVLDAYFIPEGFIPISPTVCNFTFVGAMNGLAWGIGCKLPEEKRKDWYEV